MTRSAPRSLFGSVTPPRIGNPLRTSAPVSPMETQKKADPLLASQPKKKALAPKPKQELGPFGALPGFSDGLGYTVSDRKTGIPNATAKKALDTDTAKLTRLHDMAKLTTLHDQIDRQLKQQAEAGLDLAAFDAKGTEIAQNALQNPMLDGPMRRKLTPMVEQMVGLHREGLRQRVIESHRQEADDIIAKSIERHDADAMDIAARVGRSKPASVEREHLLQALVDKSRFIEDMRGVRTGIDDDTRASQREIYQQRLALAQHEAALEQAHGTGGEKAARAYLDALSKDLSIPEALRPILARRLGIDIAHLEDRRRTKALRDARRQAHDVLSEFSQIRTGEPLAPFEDDHTDDDDMAAFRIWRAYDRWDRSPSDIPESAYRTLEHRYSDQRGAQEGELAHLAAQLEAWRADPNAAGMALDGRARPPSSYNGELGTVNEPSRGVKADTVLAAQENPNSAPNLSKSIETNANSETSNHATSASAYSSLSISELVGRSVEIEGKPLSTELPDPSKKLETVGFNVLSPGTVPTARTTEVTKEEYDKMLEEARGVAGWTAIDTAVYLLEDGWGTKQGNREIDAFKDAWVRDNQTTINVIARRYGLPADLLAAIAHTEVGGDPQGIDGPAAALRSVVSGSASAAKTSVGDVQMQIHHIRGMLRDDGKEDPIDLVQLDRALISNRALNLDLAARHIEEMRMMAYPQSVDAGLTPDQANALAFMWNNGYSPRLAGDPSLVHDEAVTGRNHMGHAYQRKIGKMKELLKRHDD